MPRQSAAVYRRRRLLVIVLSLVLVAAIGGGVWLAIAQPWSAVSGTPATSSPKPTKPAPSDSESPSEEPSDAPSPDASETPGIVACAAADIVVEAQTDADTYAAGELPELSIKLTNRGEHDCTMNVGSATQKFTVTSGSDEWWRSTDCQTAPSDMIVTMKAGKSVSSATPVIWDRTRSSVDTCEDKNRPRAPGGGASYHVNVEIGGFESETSKQVILR
ncbi:hypothetical protein [Microbacterium sp. H1-D42]|uniref:hypothetical protein n=1 Tax=Microbacterium sp. H1-D42 TaxID=2925844 RepID=UPI001F52B5CC|nr:hypothetical protein [Microbacterium sp. H1-D42]UNK71415.1 hypothetical protein MNR00_02870 [Microbacterium sp. H1-D42]